VLDALHWLAARYKVLPAGMLGLHAVEAAAEHCRSAQQHM
jgi:hypothetical protein